MRSKDLRNLRKAFLNLQGSFDEVLKNNSKPRTGKIARKKVSVKNEDFEDLGDDEDVDDYGDDEDVDDADPGLEDDDSVLETAEAIVDLVDSLPEEVSEEVKDELLGSAADEVDEGVPVDEVVENVRRRVYNIRRKVNNARRIRTQNARRLKNARRRRLFNAAAEEGLLNKASSKYQNPMSKFKNSRRFAWNDDAGDLNNGEGDGYRDAKAGDSIGSIGKPSDDGYGGDEDNNYWPENKPSGESEINTYNARVRRIINKARAYDALMNGLNCGPNGCGRAKNINLGDEREREAYNAGVLQNDRFILHNGRLYAFNEDGTVSPLPEGGEAAAEGTDLGNGIDIHIDAGQDGSINPEDIEVSVGGEPMDVEPAEGAGPEELGYDQLGGGMDLPGAGGAPAAPAAPAAAPQFNARHRGRVRNNRYRSVYNQKGTQTRVALKATPKKANNKKSEETQVNNSVSETGLDIPSTFPSKKAE